MLRKCSITALTLQNSSNTITDSIISSLDTLWRRKQFLIHIHKAKVKCKTVNEFYLRLINVKFLFWSATCHACQVVPYPALPSCHFWGFSINGFVASFLGKVRFFQLCRIVTECLENAIPAHSFKKCIPYSVFSMTCRAVLHAVWPILHLGIPFQLFWCMTCWQSWIF